MSLWQVRKAKAHFNELVGGEEPQTMMRQPDFESHLLGGPKVEAFEIERDADIGPVVIETPRSQDV